MELNLIFKKLLQLLPIFLMLVLKYSILLVLKRRMDQLATKSEYALLQMLMVVKFPTIFRMLLDKVLLELPFNKFALELVQVPLLLLLFPHSGCKK